METFMITRFNQWIACFHTVRSFRSKEVAVALAEMNYVRVAQLVLEAGSLQPGLCGRASNSYPRSKQLA